jgi:hypothetical protein
MSVSFRGDLLHQLVRLGKEPTMASTRKSKRDPAVKASTASARPGGTRRDTPGNESTLIPQQRNVADADPRAANESAKSSMTKMAKCEVCGNEYDKAFTVTREDRTHIFDSFECAIQAMAPSCNHCGCRVIGHGVEHSGSIYCCAHCANASGVAGVRDRV